MNQRPVAPLAAERVISATRLLLTASGGVALYIDGAAKAPFTVFHYAFIAYLFYSLGLCLRHLTRAQDTGAARMTLHLVDLSAGAVLNFLVESSGSPFFVFLMFVLISAALRFGSRGVVYTGSVLLAYYIALGIRDNASLRDELELARFILRVSYICTASVMLAYLMRHQEATRMQLEQLASWPRRLSRSFHDFVADVLGRASRLMNVSRTLLVWEDGNEPWLYVAMRDRQGLTIVQEPPDRYPRLIEEWALDATFSIADCGQPAEVVVFSDLVERVPGRCPIHSSLVKAFSIKDVLSTPIGSESIAGRVFFLDGEQTGVSDATLAKIITALIASGLEQHLALEQAERTAVTEERQHFARDLHDGIVQALAGANLHLYILDKLIESNPAQARATLAQIQDALANEQRDLRAYIAHLRPLHEASGEAESLVTSLDLLAQRVERQWGIKVAVDLDPIVELVSEGMRAEIQRIVREAVTNAAKHAGASLIKARLTFRGDRVFVTVQDNGRGLPFFGRFNLDELTKLQRGPVTLKERVAAIGGNLTLDSSAAGTRIDVDLPTSLIEAHFAKKAVSR